MPIDGHDTRNITEWTHTLTINDRSIMLDLEPGFEVAVYDIGAREREFTIEQ